MRIDLLSANNPRTPTTAPLRSMLGVGAIVEAIAVRDVTSGQLWLQFDNRRVPARLASGHSTGPLDGEHLKLRVLRETPVLALESVDETDADYRTEDALRRYLPRQASPTPLLANLGWLARNPDQVRSLPYKLQQTLANLWQTLPEMDDLHEPEKLNTALLRSGTFLESQLARTDAPAAQIVTQDFKAGLLALREQLRQFSLESDSTPARSPQPAGPMPNLHAPLSAMGVGPASLSLLDGVAAQMSELQQQTDGTLARIHTNQLLNNEAAQQGLLALLIELPFRHEQRADLLRFKFEREARQQGDSECSWKVEVALDLGATGSLHIQVGLIDKRLNVQMRSESPALVNAINHSLETLKTALRAQGLHPERVVCLHGQPVDSADSRLKRLLDLHA